ncbi:hypothetical protein AMTRI_Chr02g217550 [Amborella trichopoda]
MAILSALFFLLLFLLFRWCFIFVSLISCCGLAWHSRFFVEGNTPATFGHPVWSFLHDLKMDNCI